MSLQVMQISYSDTAVLASAAELSFGLLSNTIPFMVIDVVFAEFGRGRGLEGEYL